MLLDQYLYQASPFCGSYFLFRLFSIHTAFHISMSEALFDSSVKVDSLHVSALASRGGFCKLYCLLL